MKEKCGLLIGMAAIFALYMAYGYVNPYSGVIELHELVLQLSGSRGNFSLGFTFLDMVNLCMKLIPYFVFEIYFGNTIYGHFCIASTYIFSRRTNRLQWYWKEMGILLCQTCMFQCLYIMLILLITQIRYDIIVDKFGIFLLLYHLAIHTAWLFSGTALVNIAAVLHGSSMAFAAVAAGQICCIASIPVIFEAMVRNDTMNQQIGFLLQMNSAARLVLGWHLEQAEGEIAAWNPWEGFRLNDTVILQFVFMLFIVVSGGMIIRRHDLLVPNQELEG